MPKLPRVPSPLAWLACSAALLAVSASPARETRLKEKDHQALGKLISEYREAQRNSSGISDALAKITEEIAKIDKKSKDLPFLAMVEDVQQAFYWSKKHKDSVSKGRLEEGKVEGQGETVNYAIHAPKSYKVAKGPYPLLICLPDAGQTPKQHFEENWTDPALRDEVIIAICQLPEDPSAWAVMEGGIETTTLRVIRAARDEYAIDVDRVFLSARGAAVPAAVAIGQNYPHVFAGVIGRSGDMGEGTLPTNFRNLPTLFAGGGANCTAFEKAATEAGVAKCTLQPDATEADVRTWMLENPRTAHPSKVSLAPTTPFGASAYWLIADGFEPTDKPSVEGSIDRATNTITITSSEVSRLYLYVNDLLVDMDKPIVVVLNGKEQKVQLPRSLEHALEQHRRSGDTGRVYTNSYYFEASPSQE